MNVKLKHLIPLKTKEVGEMAKKVKTNIEIMNSIRKDWGDVKPFTRIEKNKKAYSRKQKHKSLDF